jgi:hypothetical protein
MARLKIRAMAVVETYVERKKEHPRELLFFK